VRRSRTAAAGSLGPTKARPFERREHARAINRVRQFTVSESPGRDPAPTVRLGVTTLNRSALTRGMIAPSCAGPRLKAQGGCGQTNNELPVPNYNEGAVVNQPGDRLIHPARKPAGPDLAKYSPGEIVAVPVMSLRPGESPRLNGEDRAHISRLAETEASLPPILVNRRTMRVIDGTHRLMAASLQGRETIDVVLFDGSDADVFLRAVQENVAHGLPLTQADRRAAAERIIVSHPHMADRAIGYSVGLAAKTVASIRKRSTESSSQSNARVGRDGRVRPLDSSGGRRRAAELLSSHPEVSLRDVARAAGISPATVLDVRKRLERGESPVPGRAAVAAAATADGGASANGAGSANGAAAASGGSAQGPRAVSRPSTRSSAASDLAATVEKLLRDPSLRNNERGKGMLRMLHVNAVGANQLPDTAAIVPPHCVAIVVQLAHHNAKMWLDFARELDGRARIIDPSASTR
jgi:ParB-like chromosome segregation protein Spo0J